MNQLSKWAVVLALSCIAAPAVAEDSIVAGRQVYEQRCASCHGGSSPAAIALGPNLAGIVGARAGTRNGGVHSRAVLESKIVWDRDSLRGFLSAPRSVLPEAMMPTGLDDAGEVEQLLDYLETFR